MHFNVNSSNWFNVSFTFLLKLSYTYILRKICSHFFDFIAFFLAIFLIAKK